MSKPFPMLAAAADLSKIVYPILGFPKIDGIRAVIHNGQALSRKLLPLPNRYIQEFFEDPGFQGLDGELVVGKPNDPLCIKHSTSGVMSHSGTPTFTYCVFDHWEHSAGYSERLTLAEKAVKRMGAAAVQILKPWMLGNEQQLLEYESRQLELGYEGIILRSPHGAYKHGRSTVREGGLLKLKRFSDSEGVVVDVVEEMFNGNEAQKDNLGRTKRSSAKAGKSGKGRAGALVVKDLTHGWIVEVGTGMTDEDKDNWWAWWQKSGRDQRLAKYKFFAHGMQDKPRHPVYLTWRHPDDL